MGPGVEGELEMNVVQELEGHHGRVWSVAWRPGTGKTAMLASCSGDKTVRLWQSYDPCSPSWSCVAVLDEMHKRTVRSCAWSPDGRLLATASFDGTTAVWEDVGGDFDCVASLEGHENEVKSVSWNSSGTLLATCGRDKSVWIWELQPGNEFECASVLHGHSQDVKMVLWHPIEDVLVSASYDNTIKVWIEDRDTEDWVCVQTLGSPTWGHTSTVWAISFNASGDRLVSCRLSIFFLILPATVDSTTHTLSVIRTSSHAPVFVGFIFSDDLTLMIWNTEGQFVNGESWKHLSTISGYHDRTIFSVDWSKSTGLIASASGDDHIRLFSEDLVVLDGCPSYKLLLKKQKAHSTDVNCVRWHPQASSLLASAGDDGIIKIWTVSHGAS